MNLIDSRPKSDGPAEVKWVSEQGLDHDLRLSSGGGWLCGWLHLAHDGSIGQPDRSSLVGNYSSDIVKTQKITVSGVSLTAPGPRLVTLLRTWTAAPGGSPSSSTHTDRANDLAQDARHQPGVFLPEGQTPLRAASRVESTS
jgi:hypothetical protein